MRGAGAIRESRGQLGTKREGHPGPHSIRVSPWLHKLVVLNPWMAHLMGPQKHCLSAVTLAFFFLVTPHCPAPQLTRPSLVFLSFWCEHDITPIKDHTKENIEQNSVVSCDTESMSNALPTGRNPASGPRSNLNYPDFSSNSNLGCNGNHTLMSALSMYQYAAGIVRLMLVIKLWRWPQGVPHPAIFSTQHAPMCARTRTPTHKQDSW